MPPTHYPCQAGNRLIMKYLSRVSSCLPLQIFRCTKSRECHERTRTKWRGNGRENEPNVRFFHFFPRCPNQGRFPPRISPVALLLYCWLLAVFSSSFFLAGAASHVERKNKERRWRGERSLSGFPQHPSLLPKVKRGDQLAMRVFSFCFLAPRSFAFPSRSFLLVYGAFEVIPFHGVLAVFISVYRRKFNGYFLQCRRDRK